MTEAVDYFCGAGGASLGLHQAGYDVTGYDHWPRAVETHNANGLLAHVHDLSDPTLDHLLHHAPLAWFSPPCQPFSAAGDGDGEYDERDGFPWALRILAHTLPTVAIFENVRGLTFRKHSRYFGSILAGIRACGYHAEWLVLNSADYGVPQTRERCFIVARRDGGRITWPSVTHTEQQGMLTERWVSMADAVPAVMNSLGRYRRGAGLIERHGERPDIDPANPAPTIHRNSEKDLLFVRTNNVTSSTDDYYRRSVDKPTPTIRLTIPELARLQDFPVDWQWCGTKTEQARQIGNACPPTMVRLLAEGNRPL